MVVCRCLYDRVGCRCVLGYAIGALLYDSLGHWLITLYGLTDKVETFRASYAEWGAVIILVKGLTPIPTSSSPSPRVAGYNTGCLSCAPSLRAAAVSSWSRSCSTATATFIRAELERRLRLWVGIGAAVLVLGFYVAFRLV